MTPSPTMKETIERLRAEVGDGIIRGEEGEEWGDLAQVSAADVRRLLASHERAVEGLEAARDALHAAWERTGHPDDLAAHHVADLELKGVDYFGNPLGGKPAQHLALEAEYVRLKEAYEKHYLPGIAAADQHSELAEKKISALEAEVEALRAKLTYIGRLADMRSKDSAEWAKRVHPEALRHIAEVARSALGGTR